MDKPIMQGVDIQDDFAQIQSQRQISSRNLELFRNSLSQFAEYFEFKSAQRSDGKGHFYAKFLLQPDQSCSL
jgi:hypothetical protein